MGEKVGAGSEGRTTSEGMQKQLVGEITDPSRLARERRKNPLRKRGGGLSEFRMTFRRLSVANVETTFDLPKTKRTCHRTLEASD